MRDRTSRQWWRIIWNQSISSRDSEHFFDLWFWFQITIWWTLWFVFCSEIQNNFKKENTRIRRCLSLLHLHWRNCYLQHHTAFFSTLERILVRHGSVKLHTEIKSQIKCLRRCWRWKWMVFRVYWLNSMMDFALCTCEIVCDCILIWNTFYSRIFIFISNASVCDDLDFYCKSHYEVFSLLQ